MYRDGHHVIWNKQEWSLRPEARSIRETPQLIVPMERLDHEEVHRHCPAVPLLGYYALVRTASQFEPQTTSLATMENLMSAIESAGNHPKAHPIEKELANLAIWAIDLQRPFIADVERKNRLIL